jgi:hypothetical protein
MRCGPRTALDADPRAHRLRCPRCGDESWLPALPLFVVTGASGTGKSTNTGPLRNLLAGCLVFEADVILHVAALGWDTWRNTWLQLTHAAALGGQATVLTGSLTPAGDRGGSRAQRQASRYPAPGLRQAHLRPARRGQAPDPRGHQADGHHRLSSTASKFAAEARAQPDRNFRSIVLAHDQLWHVFGTASRTRPLSAAWHRITQDQPPTAYVQVRGCLSRWWQVLGSNQRRLSRRFYRPLPLATRATCRKPPARDGTLKDSGTFHMRQHLGV